MNAYRTDQVVDTSDWILSRQNQLLGKLLGNSSELGYF